MRPSTLQTLGLGSVLEIFHNGKLPVTADELVDRVFGKSGKRGALVISGANGIVGAGKAMQLGSRLEPYGVPIIALDFPGVPDGMAKQYPGLVRAFGKGNANKVMGNIIKYSYDGKDLPEALSAHNPRFLLEAIPEILDIKKEHYKIFRSKFPEIDIWSVTSGFPRSSLGVGIAHPAFPHEINKIWEIVELKPSPSSQLLWALGLIPMPVSDNWSFVLDVLFCGLTLAGTRFCEATNMPFWKADKYIRKYIGPNPFRAHDAIGAAGANFLSWSCLHHLSNHYGELFAPTSTLDEKKDSGQNWYPPDHFRPLVDWSMNKEETAEFNAWILGALFQMTSLMIHENRSHLSQMNLIGELCAQFSKGILAIIRNSGPEVARRLVQDYHKLHPYAANKAWHPEVFDRIDTPEWQQLYVNAEHDGKVGVISINRESYNYDVNAELNRAIDWLKSAGIQNVIVTGDFHLSTQMIGADTTDFFPAIEDATKGVDLCNAWSATARRLHDDFKTSVGFINGKRCLGGFLELMMHCHYLVAEENAALGMPEVSLPVIPGMEGCHWPFRKVTPENYPNLLRLLLTGKPVRAKESVGWLTDFAGPLEETIKIAWKIASGAEHGVKKREVVQDHLTNVTKDLPGLEDTDDTSLEEARKAIIGSIQNSCNAPLSEAISIQSKRSGNFMTTSLFKKGAIGSAYTKTWLV
ncbi:MAG: enoyl-CoA hydratase/isomerase family protein [Bacteroidales bacterium]|nr:enoyl-CoA hydratase/isomerase family protein [Bacteroidales bacterium]